MTRPRRLRPVRFARRDDGAATIEFVILLPIFLALFAISLEVGYHLLRTSLLSMAAETAGRSVRIGSATPPTRADIRQEICASVGLFANCEATIAVELAPFDATGGTPALGPAPACFSDAGVNQGGAVFDTGEPNELMVMRVCSSAEPIFALSRSLIGFVSQVDSNLRTVVTAGWVNEPIDSAVAAAAVGTPLVKPPPSPGSGGGWTPATTVPTRRPAR